MDKEEGFIFEDETEDKKYFTIIPNYVLDNLNVYDIVAYITIKRITGENGECWMGTRNLAKKAHVSQSQIIKSLKRLTETNLIYSKGTKDVNGGKTVCYGINNVWRENIEFYSNITDSKIKKTAKLFEESKGEHQEFTTKVNTRNSGVNTRKLGGEHLGVRNKNPLIISHNKNIITDGQNINKLIDKFKDINPNYERLFSNKAERSAIERLVEKHTYDKILKVVDILPKIYGREYAPRITTPCTLERKMGDLFAYIKQEQDIKTNGIFVIS